LIDLEELSDEDLLEKRKEMIALADKAKEAAEELELSSATGESSP
jgi:hypothetical protein